MRCLRQLRSAPASRSRCGERRPDSIRGAGREGLGRAGREAGVPTEISTSFVSQEAKNMKQRLLMVILVVAMAALCIPPVFAQATGSVKGVCKDAQGTPIVGANLEWLNTDNGRKYNLKTNKKGEYFSLGIEPGKYKVTLTLDGKQLDQVAGFPVGMDESNLDFDLKKSQAEAAQQKGISPEQ